MASDDLTSEDPRDAAAIRDVAERLRSAVKAAGGNKLVAETSGVPLRTLNSYMAGDADPKLTKLDRIAEACGTTLDALLGRKPPAPADTNLITNAFGLVPGDRALQRLKGPDDAIPEGFVAVPYLDVRASAGPGRASLPAEIVAAEHFLFSRAWLRTLNVVPENAELLRAEGDSMYPTIQDGDLMLVDRGHGDIVHGKIYVLVVHDLVVVKRVNMLTIGGMILISDNERYPSETIGRADIGNLNFQGRVAWYGRAM